MNIKSQRLIKVLCIAVITLICLSLSLVACSPSNEIQKEENDKEVIKQIIIDSADKMSEIVDETHNQNNIYGMDYSKYYGTIKNQPPHNKYIEYLRENFEEVNYDNKEELINEIALEMVKICDSTHNIYGNDYYKYSNTIKGQYPYNEFIEYLEYKLK
jgi:hypothetical protein